MEIVIPPRDHGQSTFRYTWDENGEVQQMTRVQDSLPADRRVQRGRQTVQWPFQSVSTETEVPATPTATWAYGRPVTWQPKRSRDADQASLDEDIIPDYVRNYIRGETPESVARRKRNGGKLGERGVDIAHQHRPHQSRVADFEGFRDLGPTPSQMGSAGDYDENRHILSGSREKPERGWRRFMVGWRAGVALNVLLSGLMLVVAVVGLVFAIARGFGSGGQSVLFSGSCETASTIGWSLHAVISVMVVATVAGGNYVFQVLGSPMREEVDVAHSKREWLDIGVPSFRNLAYIDARRTAMAVVILLTAALTQVIYNGVIVTSMTTSDFKLVLATESFLTGAQFSNDTSSNSGLLTRLDILSLQQQANRGELTNLTTTTCLQELGGVFSTRFSAALLITDTNSPTSSVLQTSSSGTAIPRNRAPLKYCLARPSPPPTCSLLLNGPLLGAIAVLHLLALLTTALLLFSRFHPLATLGDAIASFLQSPDPTTTNAVSSLLTKSDVRQSRWGLDSAKYYLPSSHYWIQSPSLPRWLYTLLVWATTTALAATGLTHTLLSDPTSRLSPFGSITPHSALRLPTSVSPATAALIPGAAHMLLFTLYLATNALLTTYHLSHESSVFATAPAKPLRVSSRPEGEQRTSIFLTLPRWMSWLLATVFIGLDFLVGQSFFSVTMRLGGTEADGVDYLVMSGTALLGLVAGLVGVAVGVVGLGARRAEAVGVDGGNPMVMRGGSCSAVLGARCGGSGSGGRMGVGLERGRVRWGVVRRGEGMVPGRCGFGREVGVERVERGGCYS
ncbi:hypothetical protein QBC39DRAFT_374811 [Podospora conica]|nr:hypothetical protein QBC39DRAFT_374811 [Schizothecium conicum]